MIEVAIFAAKVLIVVLGLVILALAVAGMAAKASHKSHLEVEPLHQHLKQVALFLKSFTLSKDERKQEKKRQKKEKKQEENKASSGKKVFVLNFKGDIRASQVDNLREEVTAILQLATPQDEVVAKVESPGGVVHGYGLAASQLLRIRQRNIPLTVCVDKVAASGGYMMACVASRIIAAPFAILGSIGVVAQVPNLNRLLKKHDVDYKEYTAGEYKRTVSIFGEITAKGEEKFLQQLDETHDLFKHFVGGHRPQVKMAEVATGEHWYGERALALGLIDQILTSDDYLLNIYQAGTPIYEIKYEKKRALGEKISDLFGRSASQAMEKVLDRLESNGGGPF